MEQMLPWNVSCKDNPFFKKEIHQLLIRHGYLFREFDHDNWHYVDTYAGLKIEFERDQVFVYAWYEEEERLGEWSLYVRFTNPLMPESFQQILKSYFITL